MFYPFTSLKNPNIKILENEKIYWRYHILHMCTNTPEDIIILQMWTFFALLPPWQSKKSKFWKNERNTKAYYHFTHVYHKWPSHDVWFLRYGAWRTQFFVIYDHFLHFHPLTTQKIKILKKWKKHLKTLSFYTCVP